MSDQRLTGWFERLKRDIDLHDLAEKLQLKRHRANQGNYHSPHHPDKSPSLSIFDGGRGWKDWSADTGGSCIDLVMYCRPEVDSPLEAARLLGSWYGIPEPTAQKTGERRERSMVEYIADKSLAGTEPVVAYLTGRGIDEAVVRRAIKTRSVGWNVWTSNKVEPGCPGYGGAAAAFVVRTMNPGRVVAVDMRYLDPEMNGGVKTQCQGEKEGLGWTSDLTRLKKAHTVYIVESPINALSVESAGLPNGTAAFAIRGTGNVDNIDWRWLRGKQAVIALDHTDQINAKTGLRPGLAAAWRLSEALTALDIGSMLVDMLGWDEGCDINDVLQEDGADKLRQRLRIFEPWLIPGMPGAGQISELEKTEGRRRVFLPSHDLNVYWRFRCKQDFTQYVDEFKTDEDGNRSESIVDLCSFRVAAMSRLKIQSHLATINGTQDNQPETVFGISAQLARYGSQLVREVVTDDKIYNLEWWRGKFGHIWRPQQFARLINILERSAGIGAREVVNFVGLAWRDGQLTAQEGNDCYFTEPVKQCLYHNLAFPRGTREQARQVLEAFQTTFTHNAASIALVWALGAHLKVVLGFYPHFSLQAEKGAGKSQLLDHLQSALAFQVLSGQMLATDHRRRASVSWTSQPVGWDEFSKLPKSTLGSIDGLLQSTYRFEFTRIGAALTPYLMCSPVMLVGEEVDVQSLQSKVCRSTLSVKRQGPMIPHGLPPFPVWPWLQFLASVEPARIRAMHEQYTAILRENSRADNGDATARRMVQNYAVIGVAWALLAEFVGVDAQQGSFIDDLAEEMNVHLADTDGARLPWVWIMEILLSEIEANKYEHPYCWDVLRDNAGQPQVCLFLRPQHVMDHISTAPHLRQKFDHLPIKTGRIFKRQLMESGVVLADDIERTVRSRRSAHMTAISLERLERLGLYASPLLSTSQQEEAKK